MKSKVFIIFLAVFFVPAIARPLDLPMRDLEDALGRRVLDDLGLGREAGARVAVSEVQVVGGVAPSGRVDGFTVEPRSRVRPGGVVSFDVEAIRGAKAGRHMVVRARVRVFRTVVRAIHKIRMNEVVGRGDVELALLDMTRVPGPAALSMDSVIGMAAARPITAGRVVRTDYLKSPLMVRKGQSVVVVARAGQILVRARATALVNGGLHSMVKARSTGGRIISGVVTGPGKILVQVP